MTINSEVSEVTAGGNGVATSFSFSPMTIAAASHLSVVLISPALVETALTLGVPITIACMLTVAEMLHQMSKDLVSDTTTYSTPGTYTHVIS